MTHSYGYRAKTRSLFARPFRKHGQINMTPYLTVFKFGEYVDIKADGAVHKGMPYRIYHGRTGKIWNVTPHAVGVEVNKRVKHRIFRKRIHVRIEHVAKSDCQKDLLERRKQNAEILKNNRENPDKKKALIRRKPAQPRPGHLLAKGQTIEDVTPLPFVETL